VSGSFYLTKTTLEGREEVTVDGRSVLEAYPALQSALGVRCGREVAALFAEPVITRGNGAVPTSVSWYTPYDGEPVRLDSLDPAARALPEARLRDLLAEASKLLDDPGLGPMVAGALQLADPGSVWVVDGHPVLTDWAVLPEPVNRTAARRDEHFRGTLGRYLAMTRAPQATGPMAEPPPPPRRAPPSPPVSEAPPVQPPPAPPPVVVAERPWRGWIPLLVAVLLLAGILAYISIPGVLLYPPEPPAPPAPGIAEDVAVREEINATLEERIRELQNVLGENQCVAEGNVLPSSTGNPGQPLVPPPAEQVRTPGIKAPADTPPIDNLSQALERATVLVLAPTSGDGVSIGSGFLVAPGTVLTNRHVVENAADPNRILVVNKAMGGLKQARVKARTESAPEGAVAADFALLEAPEVQNLPVLPLATALKRGDSVHAAGYPAFALETDESYRRLLETADSASLPEIVETQGLVTALQNPEGELPLVLHQAEIDRGNSGGPLVDLCGRVVGVNTFGRLNAETGYRVNIALKVEALERFLTGAGIPVPAAAEVCEPQIARLDGGHPATPADPKAAPKP
jgi:S1-C subfamily serine protease